MKEIGGYFELEHYQGQEYYPDLFKFNLGRTAITHFLKEVNCHELYVPAFLCDSVTEACRREGIVLREYHINADFTPRSEELPTPPLGEDIWILVVNYYGQLTDETILALKEQYDHVLFDLTHAFFQRPIPEIDSVVSVRKFLGVPDGAYLKTRRTIAMPQETDQSHLRFSHLLGRFEESAGVHYEEMLQTANSYHTAPARLMSPLTSNLLRSFEYERIADRRMRNYLHLHLRLRALNQLEKDGILRTPKIGPFCYPLLISSGITLRKELAKRKIFVPTYWSNVIQSAPSDSIEYHYAADILALPCDQRYDEDDMDTIADTILSVLPEPKE